MDDTHKYIILIEQNGSGYTEDELLYIAKQLSSVEVLDLVNFVYIYELTQHEMLYDPKVVVAQSVKDVQRQRAERDKLDEEKIDDEEADQKFEFFKARANDMNANTRFNTIDEGSFGLYCRRERLYLAGLFTPQEIRELVWYATWMTAPKFQDAKMSPLRKIEGFDMK